MNDFANKGTPPSLQHAMDKAGGAANLLWKPDAPSWAVPVVKPEFTGWAAEQAAWGQGVALSDLSHHMNDLFIKGPDALKLLSDYSANSYANFEIGQAKQYIPVNANGDIITDGILMRDGAEAFTLSGVPSSQNWVRWHGEQNGYDVAFDADPDSGFRGGRDPVLFRYQIQGPRALDLVAAVFGGPLPQTKFFHSVPVTLAGRAFRALRHGMAGQAGYEFIGPWEHAGYVKDAFLKAGIAFDLIQVGGLAYSTNGIESGWIPTPTPGIYSDPDLHAYRTSLKVFSFEGQKPLYGTFRSDNIEDYYVSPWELGYGRSIKFDHDFYGRDALQAAETTVNRTRVTLELDKEQALAEIGPEDAFFLSYGRYSIEINGKIVGMTFYTGRIAPTDRVMALSLIDKAFAEPGTKVDFVWGSHPGLSAPANAEHDYSRISATVWPSPYSSFARTQYRQNG
ncbi:MAG: aminomethyltransferase family protein [Rhodobacteraceae bacterium]|nr:aminomethyltransferase family protein [Paracoccaceae bacterium]PHR55916.1 MAG: aminomethyltransferase [Robiginitomaculum sp.]